MGTFWETWIKRISILLIPCNNLVLLDRRLQVVVAQKPPCFAALRLWPTAGATSRGRKCAIYTRGRRGDRENPMGALADQEVWQRPPLGKANLLEGIPLNAKGRRVAICNVLRQSFL